MDAPRHLNALRAFEATARHLSFSDAAKELNVTSAAVGQLVRTLEDFLGVILFHRRTSGRHRLKLTVLGETMLPDIQVGFEYLSNGIKKVEVKNISKKLTVAISPTFATKWLLPRIENFQKAYPDIEICFDTDLKPVDFQCHGIDIAVRYGAGKWAGLVAEKLMGETIFPVCSPSFYNSNKDKLLNLKKIVELPLIHCLALDNHSGFTTWDKWLNENQIKYISHSGFKINNSAAVLQLAKDGLGIALARSVIAQDDIRTGSLIRLFPEIECRSKLDYYVVYREEYRNEPKLVAFRNWLIQEVAKI